MTKIFPRLLFSLLLGHVSTSTVDADRTLTQGSIIKFRHRAPFGRPIRVYFNDQTPHEEGTVTMVSIQYDDDGVPDMTRSIAAISTMVSTGTITFSSVEPTSPYEQMYSRGFPFNAEKYWVCFGKSHDHEEEFELITDCKSLIVKDHKKEMIEKARIWTPTVLKDDERLGFKVKFRTGITRKNQWISLFQAKCDGGPPTSGHDAIYPVYTACNAHTDNPCNKKKKRGEVDIETTSFKGNGYGIKQRPVPVGSYYVCLVFLYDQSDTVMKCSEKIEVVSTCLPDEVDVDGYGCLPRVIRNELEMVYVASIQSWNAKLVARQVHVEIAHECGGELASILNGDESSRMVDLAKEHESSDYWIGLSKKKTCKDKSTDCWMWDDGSALGWTHWDKDQPNDGESYVMVHPLHDGVWHEYPETHEAYAMYIMPLGFVTEWWCDVYYPMFYESVYCD